MRYDAMNRGEDQRNAAGQRCGGDVLSSVHGSESFQTATTSAPLTTWGLWRGFFNKVVETAWRNRGGALGGVSWIGGAALLILPKTSGRKADRGTRDGNKGWEQACGCQLEKGGRGGEGERACLEKDFF